MKNSFGYLLDGAEVKYQETCVGNYGGMTFIYARYRPKTKAYNKQYVPPIQALNSEMGQFLNLKFMRRHDLPETLYDHVWGYVTRSQLDQGIYFLDQDTGKYYLADTADKMRMRESRRHLVCWKRVPEPTMPTPSQRLMRAVHVKSQAQLKAFKPWYDELLKAEEAIHVLEPDILKERNGYKILLTHDFASMIREAYHSGMHPSAVLADVSNRNYIIPALTLCEVGTVVRYHECLEKAV